MSKYEVLKQSRFSLAPLTNLQSHEDGTLSEEEYNWLVSRAQGGFDLTISCASHVSKDGQGWPGELACYDDKFIPGLKRLADGIQKAGSHGILQIFHGGAFADPTLVGTPMSSSAGWNGNEREATLDELDQLVVDFGQAARRAQQAGWSGVEIHGANGYILSQFLGTISNQRKDLYGGSLENRFRLLNRVVESVKAAVDESFIVGVRLSPEDGFRRKVGIVLEDSLQVIAGLQDLGVDYIHISAWDVFKKPNEYPHHEKTLMEILKEAMAPRTFLMAAGGIWTKEDAEKAFSLGIDILALGKAAIVNPSWVQEVYNHGKEPQKLPVSESLLRDVHVSQKFADYLRNFPEFVK